MNRFAVKLSIQPDSTSSYLKQITNLLGTFSRAVTGLLSPHPSLPFFGILLQKSHRVLPYRVGSRKN